MYQATTATNKILGLTKRIRGIAGGTSASKTDSILLWLIDRAQASKEKEVISIVSESMPHLRKGAMRDFLNIMQEHKYFQDDKWEKTNSVYTFATGTIIEFFGIESWEKVKGARRDILFINEANHISLEAYNQLEIRTKKIVWLDWNPESEFWWYTDVVPTQDVDFLTLTYKDNEALDPLIIQTIESRQHNKNWWKVYGQGQLGEVESRIYTGWIELDEIPDGARLKRKGLDFGYTNDPTALIDIYTWNNAFIWDELLYKKGLSNKDIADVILHSDTLDALVIADSSEPKSIDELKTYGVEVLPSQKGPGSVLQGIAYVQSQTVYVTKRSVNILKEYRNYLWLTDKSGKSVNTPQDFLNHCLDAGRYGMESLAPVEEEIKQTPPSWYHGGFNKPRGRVR